MKFLEELVNLPPLIIWTYHHLLKENLLSLPVKYFHLAISWTDHLKAHACNIPPYFGL